MGLNYGSNFKPSYLPQGEVGTTQIINNDTNDWYRTVQILLNVVQFGLAFVPGVGEMADLAIAGIQTGIEQEVTGKIDPMTAGLNFGMSGIGIATKGINNLVPRTITSSSGLTLGDVSTIGKYIGNENLGRELTGVHYTADAAQAHQRTKDMINQLNQAHGGGLNLETGGLKFQMGEYYGGTYPMDPDVLNNAYGYDISSGIQSVTGRRGNLQKFIESRVEQKEFTKGIFEAGKGGMPIDSLSSDFNEHKWLQDQIDRINKDINSLKNWNEAGVTAGRGASEGYQTERKVVEKLKSSLSLTEHEIYQLRKLINEFGQITNKRMFYAILRKSFARTNNELIGVALKGGTQKLIRQLVRKETTAARLARISGQAVKKTTKAMKIATNPGYVVRKFIKDTVGKIEEEAVSIAKKKAIALLAKGGKQAAKLEGMFAKSGGIIMDSSVIMGYKLIADELEWKTMLIKFRPDATSSKSGRNKGGKVDVIVNCNEQEFLAFTKAPSKMGYYLDNWARSRGGRYPNATSLDAMGISNEMVDILGFLPIKQIRPYLALSTMVKNVATSKGIPFIWKSEYFDKIKEDFISEALKETAGNSTHLLPHNISKYAKRAVDSAMDGNGITKISESMIASQARKAERRHRTKQVKKIGTVSKIGVRSVKLFR